MHSKTRLSPPWLHFARAGWVLISLIALIAFIAELIVILPDPLPSCTDPEAICGPWQISREDIDLGVQSGLPEALLVTLYYSNGFIPARGLLPGRIADLFA